MKSSNIKNHVCSLIEFNNEQRSGDGSTLTGQNGIAGYYGHSSGGSSSGHCSATSMSYDSSCSTDSSRKSSNSSTNGSANTVGGNSRY